MTKKEKTVGNKPVSEEDGALLNDLYTIGKFHVSEGVEDFGEWSEQMIEECGEFVRPHLQPVWDRIHPASQSATRQKRGDRLRDASGSIDSNVLAAQALKNENRRLKRRLAYARKKLAAAREPGRAEEEEATHATSQEGGPNAADSPEKVGPMGTVPRWMYDPNAHSDELNLRWCWLRAVEWIHWPLFVSEPLVPLVLAFWSWQRTTLAVLICAMLWRFLVVPRLVSLTLANLALWFVRLKWVACPLMCFYFYATAQPAKAVIALLWPILVLPLQFLVPTASIGPIQRRFMSALGHVPAGERDSTDRRLGPLLLLPAVVVAFFVAAAYNFGNQEPPPVASSALGPSQLPQDIRKLLSTWVQSTLRGDLTAQVECYGPRVEVFFRKKDITREDVKLEKQKVLTEFPDIKTYDISGVEIESAGADRVVINFRKRWDSSGNAGKEFSGEEKERLTLARFAERWLIVGEEELQIFRVHKAQSNAGAMDTKQSVPMLQEGGVYVIPVFINNAITLNFVVDSGATDVSIPADVVRTLMRTGTVTDSDFIGTQAYTLADGSTTSSPTFRIRSLKVGGIVLQDVVGTVANTKGDLLLGQSFLGQFKSWSIDNTKHALVLE